MSGGSEAFGQLCIDLEIGGLGVENVRGASQRLAEYGYPCAGVDLERQAADICLGRRDDYSRNLVKFVRTLDRVLCGDDRPLDAARAYERLKADKP